jgi:hypothetical protein
MAFFQSFHTNARRLAAYVAQIGVLYLDNIQISMPLPDEFQSYTAVKLHLITTQGIQGYCQCYHCLAALTVCI